MTNRAENRAGGEDTTLVGSDIFRRANPIRINQITDARGAGIKVVIVGSAAIIR